MPYSVYTPVPLLACLGKSSIDRCNFVGQTQLQEPGKLAIAIRAACNQIEAGPPKNFGEVPLAQGRGPGHPRHIFSQKGKIIVPDSGHMMLLLIQWRYI